jgi:signal transduction histidine kinase
MLALANDSTKDLLENVAETDALDACRKAISNMPKVDAAKVQVILDDQTNGQTMLTTNGDSLLQMLDFLLENAVKFTEAGHIRLAVRHGDGQMQFIVEDTGCGIAADKVDSIFEPFMKGDEFKQGLGLGLAYCHETAEKLGGSLVFDRNYHEGASFILTLPINLTQK